MSDSILSMNPANGAFVRGANGTVPGMYFGGMFCPESFGGVQAPGLLSGARSPPAGVPQYPLSPENYSNLQLALRALGQSARAHALPDDIAYAAHFDLRRASVGVVPRHAPSKPRRSTTQACRPTRAALYYGFGPPPFTLTPA